MEPQHAEQRLIDGLDEADKLVGLVKELATQSA